MNFPGKKSLRKAGVIFLCSLIYSCGGNGNLFEPMADKNSTESCKVSVSQNLDKGNYDAVISSPCASDMDKGAAYLGKAGFDIKNVIDRLVDGSKSKDSAIDIYIKAMVPEVKPETLDFLDMAESHYSKVQNVDGNFYLSITQTLKTLTLIKSVITFSGTGDKSGELKESCDLNNNGIPDDVDATACALEIAGNTSISTSCSITGLVIQDKGNIQIGGQNYRGVVFKFKFNIYSSSCPTEYKKVYYQEGGYYYVVTTSGECKDSNGNLWPCPVRNENNKDFVGVIYRSIDSMVENIQLAIPSQKSDIKDSIDKIRDEIISGCENPEDRQCISKKISDYIKNIKK